MKTVILSFSIAHNSVGDYFIRLSNRLASRYRVIIVTDKNDQHPFSIDPNIAIHRWPSTRPTKLRDFLFLYKLFRTAQPSLTISIFGAVNIFLIAGFLARVPNRIAWIRTLSTQFPQQKHKVIRKKMVYKLATGIITNSDATRNDAISVYNVHPLKIRVLPNSVADNVAKYAPIAIDEQKILYVGRLHPSKGIDVLIKAFAEVHKKIPNVTLDIVGSGTFQHSLLRLVKDNNLSDVVNFIGNLSKDHTMKAFASAYCSVVPSYSEAFGYTVIESMSMRTCVIGANNTGIQEIIIDGESGLLFNTGDHQDLATKILSVFQDRELRDRLAIGGYIRFKKEYDLAIAAERDFQYFEELL
ncbi:MAG TPA: glycosyltransferase family 4 protein [Flavobacterium sp.]|jgi:glycosyltransferase involved in cell wall biosynthesis